METANSLLESFRQSPKACVTNPPGNLKGNGNLQCNPVQGSKVFCNEIPVMKIAFSF